MLSSCTHLSGLQACTRRRYGPPLSQAAVILPASGVSSWENRPQPSPLAYTVTPGLRRHPWPTPSPLVYTVTPAYTVTPGVHSHPCIHHHPCIHRHPSVHHHPWCIPSPLAYTITPGLQCHPCIHHHPGVHHHPWPTLSPLHTPSPLVYTVTTRVHCHPWPTLSSLHTPSSLAYTVTTGRNCPSGWRAECAYRRMAFANSVASSLSPHAVRSSARDRAGEAASGHS